MLHFKFPTLPSSKVSDVTFSQTYHLLPPAIALFPARKQIVSKYNILMWLLEAALLMFTMFLLRLACK